ncbi:MAG: class I SAM-dependent methyltransferase [Bifidobacterium sp.]|uniref:class I SAM-dependent methyltransferase n=1 Tax=Bifidobacterium sp. TaxID=41200 RepID=UPI0039EB7189
MFGQKATVIYQYLQLPVRRDQVHPRNPWKDVNLSDYESHMSLDSVHQLQALDEVMKAQFSSVDADTIMILGVAGGNGLEHIDSNRVAHVYGVDINEKYLSVCQERYPQLQGVFTPVLADVTDQDLSLSHAEFVVANLVIEYIGYEAFLNVLSLVQPRYVSCVLQVNEADGFVSQSPYEQTFKDIVNVYHHVDEHSLTQRMHEAGYIRTFLDDKELPNSKKLRRCDYMFEA